VPERKLQHVDSLTAEVAGVSMLPAHEQQERIRAAYSGKDAGLMTLCATWLH
jgi:hypothetical protein